MRCVGVLILPNGKVSGRGSGRTLRNQRDRTPVAKQIHSPIGKRKKSLSGVYLLGPADRVTFRQKHKAIACRHTLANVSVAGQQTGSLTIHRVYVQEVAQV